MDINKMTRKQFDKLPFRKNWQEPVEFASMVILPLRTRHGSGYRALDFVAINNKGQPICRLSGCSDVIHVDGIGGFGNNWLKQYGTVPKAVPATGWSVDCLATSGLLRMWPNSYHMTCGGSLSSFEIYALEKEAEKKKGGNNAD